MRALFIRLVPQHELDVSLYFPRKKKNYLILVYFLISIFNIKTKAV